MMYIKNDIPALKLGDAKLWWKEKTLQAFGKKSCGLSNREYEEIKARCIGAVKQTKVEIDNYRSQDENVKVFLDGLKACWIESIH